MEAKRENSIAEALRQGCSYDDIVLEFNTSKSTISGIKKKYNISKKATKNIKKQPKSKSNRISNKNIEDIFPTITKGQNALKMRFCLYLLTGSSKSLTIEEYKKQLIKAIGEINE